MSGRRSRRGGALFVQSALGWALLVCAGPSPAQTAAAVAAPAASAAPDTAALAADGRRRYTGLCARCHGLNLVTAGIGFDLRTFPRDDKARFVRSVSNGLRAMPAFASVVQAADIDAIWAYIGSVNGWPQ